MSYVIDVYQKKYEPETNIFRLALFTAYLPQLLQGPIGRYDRLAPQLFEPHDFNLKNIEYGAQRIAWGLAKKLILADRAYVFSKAVFADLNTYSGMYVIVALLTFSIYEYCDFPAVLMWLLVFPNCLESVWTRTSASRIFQNQSGNSGADGILHWERG